MKPRRTADGQIGGALLFSALIAEQIAAKRALAESEVRFRAMFENVAVGIAHFGSDLRWLKANKALCRILGWPRDELLTKRLRDISHKARHRAKNILDLVPAIARQIATGDARDLIGRFTERIRALTANQDLGVRHQWQRIDVRDLAQVQLGHFADLIGSRINLDGPKLHLNAAAAEAIGLALRELASNAGRYGALSTDAGRVDVSWQVDDDTFMMSWIDRNGPPVWPPERKGFGSAVTSSTVKQTLGCGVKLDYAPSGLEWRLTCHATDALQGQADSRELPVHPNHKHPTHGACDVG